MKRDIYAQLTQWKSSKYRKPLLLQGARQTGKTYIIKDFGKREYENVVYCNFEEDPKLDTFFKDDLKPFRLLETLSTYKKQPIKPGSTLLVFDEIQISDNALNSLKYFDEEAPEYHLMAAGSLLGIKLASSKSFPVGKVTILPFYPMTFPEFLDAMGETRYRAVLENIKALEPLPEPFHLELIQWLKKYYITGGMPAAVGRFVDSRSFDDVRSVQMDIVKSYILDFAKHAPKEDVPRLSLIWDSLPYHLARENKKFMFSALSKHARGREYESALRWLKDAGLIHFANAVETVQQPLQGFIKRDVFKVYALDVGLLGAMSKLHPDILINGNELFTTWHGAFAENFAAQQMAASFQENLCYWKVESHKTEVDFLFEQNGAIYPLEIKAGINPKSKSLSSYINRFQPPLAVRATLLNLKKESVILNVPLYAVNYIGKWLSMALMK